MQLIVGDADEAFREAAAALAPLANVTVVRAPPNAGDSAFVHSALCYAHALELCSQHARYLVLTTDRGRLPGSTLGRQAKVAVRSGAGSESGSRLGSGSHLSLARIHVSVSSLTLRLGIAARQLPGRSAQCTMMLRCTPLLCRYVLVVEDDVVAAPGYLGRLSGAIAAAESLQASPSRYVLHCALAPILSR